MLLNRIADVLRNGLGILVIVAREHDRAVEEDPFCRANQEVDQVAQQALAVTGGLYEAGAVFSLSTIFLNKGGPSDVRRDVQPVEALCDRSVHLALAGSGEGSLNALLTTLGNVLSGLRFALHRDAVGSVIHQLLRSFLLLGNLLLSSVIQDFLLEVQKGVSVACARLTDVLLEACRTAAEFLTTCSRAIVAFHLR